MSNKLVRAIGSLLAITLAILFILKGQTPAVTTAKAEKSLPACNVVITSGGKEIKMEEGLLKNNLVFREDTITITCPSRYLIREIAFELYDIAPNVMEAFIMDLPYIISGNRLGSSGEVSGIRVFYKDVKRDADVYLYFVAE